MPIDTPTLEITNEADAGAVTATIFDGDPAATNDVKYARITGELGELQWATLDQRVGDGEIEGTVTPGHYLWVCFSALAGETVLSSVVFQPITSGDESLHEQILQAVEARATLALSGTEYAVQRMKIPFDGNVSLPGCIVTTFEETESGLGGTTGTDDISRPVILALVSTDAHDDDTESSLHMARQLIRRAFQSQRLPGVSEVMVCEIDPSPVLLLIEGKTEYQQSQYVLRFQCREPRGIGA